MQPLLLVQVMRAVAALAVALLHTLHDVGMLYPGHTAPPQLQAGVDIFFVISGLIMVYASHPGWGQEGAAAAFLQRRIARILPLYWATTLLFLCVSTLLPGALNSAAPGMAEILASFAFLPWMRSDGLLVPVYSLGWTLNYEIFFYAVFAVALASRSRAVPMLVALMIGALVVAGLLLRPTAAPLVVWTSPLMLEFLFGVALGVMRLRGVALPAWLRALLFAAGAALLAGDVLAAWAGRAVAWGLPAALLMAGVVLGPEPRLNGRLARLAVLLGDASYALYLLHPFAVRAARLGWGKLHLLPLGAAGFIACCLLLACLLAVAVHRLFERPMTRLLQRRAGAPA